VASRAAGQTERQSVVSRKHFELFMVSQASESELHDRFVTMYEMYLDGHSYEKIGKRFGISRERVRQILKKRSSTDEYEQIRQRVLSRRVNTWQVKEIASLISNGYSCREIAGILGCSIDCVKRVSSKYQFQKLKKVG